MSKTTNRFSPEVRARAVRMVFEHEREHPSRWAAVCSIATKIGCTAQRACRKVCQQAEKWADWHGFQAGFPSEGPIRSNHFRGHFQSLRQAHQDWPDGALPTRHQHLSGRHQGLKARTRGRQSHPSRLPRRVELHHLPKLTRFEVIITGLRLRSAPTPTLYGK
jgi:transposase